jgi:hypothetical protein
VEAMDGGANTDPPDAVTSLPLTERAACPYPVAPGTTPLREFAPLVVLFHLTCVQVYIT